MTTELSDLARELDLLVHDLEVENRRLKARNEMLEADCLHRRDATLKETIRRLERAEQHQAIDLIRQHFDYHA